MKLLADESVDAPIVAQLRQDGHEVASIAEESPGLKDEAVLDRAYRDGIVCLTADKDFGELVYRQRLPHAGVLLLRLTGLSELAKCEIVSRIVTEHTEELANGFSVLTGNDLRMRRDLTT